MTQKVGFIVESREVSEPGTGTGWDHIDGRRWGRRNVSDSSVEMPDAQHEENHDESGRGGLRCETHGSSMFYRLKHCNALQSMLSVFIPKRVVSSSGMGSAAGNHKGHIDVMCHFVLTVWGGELFPGRRLK